VNLKKTIANDGKDVKIHYGNSGKTKFLDDNGGERFELRGKGDELTYNSHEKGWQMRVEKKQLMQMGKNTCWR